MNNLPIVFKGIVNILLFVFYVVIVSFAFSFLFPLVLQVLGKSILDPTDPIFMKIQIFILLLVFVISIVLRKYFYIPVATKKPIMVKKMDEKKEEELKIQIEKEIK